MRRVSMIVLTSLTLVLLTTSSRADAIIDPAGDFLSTYAGPSNGDLDVTRAEVIFNGSEFLFTSTSAAPIGTTSQGFFVWGINRGAGTARFGIITVGGNTYDASGVLFDSVVIIRPGGASTVNDLILNISTPLALENITFNGNDLAARVPLSLLTSLGLRPDQYTVNLWPRFGGAGVTGNAQISDFAPNNSNALVTTVPESTTLLLLGTGLAGAGVAARKRRKASDSPNCSTNGRRRSARKSLINCAASHANSSPKSAQVLQQLRRLTRIKVSLERVISRPAKLQHVKSGIAAARTSSSTSLPD